MIFPDLLDSALAGTQNHPPPTILRGDEALAPEAKLLRGASMDGVRWLAGRPLEHPNLLPHPAPAGPESASKMSPAASARLVDILERRPEMLREWLQLARDRGLRVPPLHLPDLLEHVRLADMDVLEPVLEVGGERMIWLASFNADWRFAAHRDPQEQFASGSRQERAVALRRIRRRDPERARLLLEEVWRSERGEDRANLLAALEPGLSLADENALEHAVRDPRREVRDVALHLIRRLPNSEFSARWTERAQNVLSVRHGVLVIDEPREVSPAWEADGLDPMPPKGLGATGWWLQQMVALTPPGVWPPDMLVMIERSDWSMQLSRGLVEAAEAYGDETWCARLIDSDATTDCALQLVATRAGRWSPEFSHFLIERLSGRVEKHYAGVAAVLRVAPLRLDPGVLPRAEAWLESRSGPLWLQPALERLVSSLEYRVAMRRELGWPHD